MALDGGDDGCHKIRSVPRCSFDGGKRTAPLLLAATRAHRAYAFDLAALDLRIDSEDVDPGRGIVREPIHADDDRLRGIDCLLRPIRGVLNLTLNVSCLDGGERATHVDDSIPQLGRIVLDARGSRFQSVLQPTAGQVPSRALILEVTHLLSF
jgi:hypothetical protein